MDGLKYLKIIMYVGGMKNMSEEKSVIIKTLYYIWRAYLIFAVFSTFFLCIIDIFVKKNATFFQICPNIMNSAIFAAAFFRIYRFIVYSEQVEAIFHFVDHLFKNVSCTLSMKVTNAYYVKMARTFPCIWICYIMSTVLSFALPPLCDTTGLIQLPLTLWFPYDIRKDNFTYILTFNWALMCQLLLGFIFVSHDCFVIVMAILMRGQIYILGYELKHIFHTALEMHGVQKSAIKLYFENKWMSEVANRSPVVYQEEMQITMDIDTLLKRETFQNTLNHLLSELIEYHQKIIKCASLFQNFESPMLFIVLALGLVYVTFTEFNLLVMNSDMVTQAVLLYYTLCCYVEFFVLTYNLHMLTHDSEAVRDNLLHIYWFFGNKKFKSNLLFMLKRMEEPIKIRGGDYFTYSIPLYINLCKTCFSYMTLLRHFEQRSD